MNKPAENLDTGIEKNSTNPTNFNIQVEDIISLDNLVENLDTPESYEDFIKLKEELINKINNLFINKLLGKNEDFTKAFIQSNTSLYNSNNESEIEELHNLIASKNSYLHYLYLKAIESGKLSKLFSEEELRDIEIIISSGVLSFFDSIVYKWKTSARQNQNSGFKNPNEKINYGGVLDGKVVGYNSLGKLPEFDFSEITNPNLKAYFSKVAELLKEGIYDYDAWIKTGAIEMETWKDNESNLVVVGPMEKYYFPDVLVEPEIEIFIKKSLDGLNEKMVSLSEKYFDGNNYNLGTTNFALVEPFLSGGLIAFKSLLGKSFPNDTDLKKEYGNHIYMIPSRIPRLMSNAIEDIKKLFGEEFEFDFEAIVNKSEEEITYHEYGHSLFKVDENNNSRLEETKATLFYYLQLFNENSKNPYSVKQIEDQIKFIFFDSIRMFKRLHKPEYEQYIILMKINLYNVFKCNLVKWEGDKLVISADKDNFSEFLNRMKDLLFIIKRLYENYDRNAQLEEFEFIQDLNDKLNNDLRRILLILKKED